MHTNARGRKRTNVSLFVHMTHSCNTCQVDSKFHLTIHIHNAWEYGRFLILLYQMAATRFRLTQLFSNNLQLIGVRSSANIHQPNIRHHHICTQQSNQYKTSRLFGGHDSSEYFA